MKNYLLGTNICIFYMKGKFNLDHKMNGLAVENLFISEITLAELKYGLIGATAVAHGLILVTNNSRHLARIKGVELEDWTQ